MTVVTQPSCRPGIQPDAVVPATLFHGTGIYCLANIVLEDRLFEGAYWGKFEEPHGPRLTASFEIARQFIEYNLDENEGGILVFDARLILAPIIAYRDSLYGGDAMPDELEFALITPCLEQISGALRSVICSPRVIEEARTREFMECARNEGGWPFGEQLGCFERANAALDSLAAHPKLNAWIPTGCELPYPEWRGKRAAVQRSVAG